MSISAKVRLFNFFRNVFKNGMLEQWLVTRTAGKSPNNFYSKLVPNPYQYQKPTYRTFTRDGITLTVDISDYIGHYYYFGFVDDSHDSLFELCKPNAIIFDIGANIGFTALKMAQISKSGLVVGFEPDPFNYSRCLINLSQNHFANLKVLNIGLGNKEALLHLEVRTPSNRGGNRINNSRTDGVEVQVKKLDFIFPTLQVDHVNLVKIDVEGYEMKVLQGAEQTLKKFRPTLFIELDDNNLKDQGDSAQTLVAFLMDIGYRSVVRAGSNEALSPNTDFSNCHYDIIVS